MKITALVVFFFLFFGSIFSGYAALTNSGIYSGNSGAMWADVMNTEKGLIDCKNMKFWTLVNYGTVTLEGCIMSKEVSSWGSLDAKSTLFLHNLTVGGGKTILTSCHLENIFIADGFFKESTELDVLELVLKGKTIVHGSIVFQSGQGKVYKGGSAVILGEVINGVVLDLQEPTNWITKTHFTKRNL